MSADRFTPVDRIPGLMRVENTDREELLAHCLAAPGPAQADERYCTVEEHVDCPPERAYDYLRVLHNLQEWTYSVRDLEPAGAPGLSAGYDRIEEGTRIFCRVVANPDAMTIDYHCSWDQGDRLWMIYLMRVVPAALVLDRPGSVITWTNCRHPYYDANPYPRLAPSPDRPWVGRYWDLFRAGHTLELRNLKTILEYRHANGEPVGRPPQPAVPR
ncbi:SRPBCC family protein [Actinoplanes sp. NPDC049118]|uniref:SRPBCC family protein n=1 Tax=Actinoplanes sp. NPDC049118 TaxID=3155769 RepID=UPI0033CB1494